MGTISATLCASARCYGAVLVYQKGAPPINFISVVSLCSRREIAAEEESAHSAPVPLSSLSLFIGLGGFVFFPLPLGGAFGVKLCRNFYRGAI